MTRIPLQMLALLLAHSIDAGAAGNDWMTALNGALPLSQFSIPGTHDSGARFEPLAGTAKCQDLTIGGQLTAGVRFLDIRCRHVGSAFTIHHGPVEQKLSFTEVLDTTLAFLDAHPGETVLMSVKEEYTASGTTRSFESTFDHYVARNPSRWLLGAEIPTLNDARGKIVLFRRFRAQSAPKGIDASRWQDDATFTIGATLRVQDEYRVASNDSKWEAIQAALEAARDGRRETLYVNFASGVASGLLGIPNIPKVSNAINPRLTAYLTNRPRGRFGVILLDFADAEKAGRIYATNPPADR